MAYGFNDDRSKVEVHPASDVYTKSQLYTKSETYSKTEIDQMDSVNDQALTEEADTRALADTALGARIDTILIGYDNDPNKDSELVDIRTGYDGVVYTVAGDAVREQIKELIGIIALFEDDWHIDEHRAQFITDGTYTHNSVIFSDVEFKKGKTYIIEVITKGQVPANNGYWYMLNDDSTAFNTYSIPPSDNPYRYEYTPANNYTKDITLGWSVTGVSGFIRIYEKSITAQKIMDVLIEENEVWS